MHKKHSQNPCQARLVCVLCLPACVSAPCVGLVPREARRVLHPLELELRTVELPIWVLEMKPGSSGRTPLSHLHLSIPSVHILVLSCTGSFMAPRLTTQVLPVDRQGWCKIQD